MGRSSTPASVLAGVEGISKISTVPVLMMTVAQFAEAHGISEQTVRRCIKGTSASFPPLFVKRVRKPGSDKSLIYITAEQATAWRNSLADA